MTSVVDAFEGLHDAGMVLQRLKKNSKKSDGKWKALSRAETKELAERDPSLIAGFPSTVGLAINDVDAHNGEHLEPRIKCALEKTSAPPICQYSTPNGQHIFHKMKKGQKYKKYEFGEIIVGDHYCRVLAPQKWLEAVNGLPSAEEADFSKLPPIKKDSRPKEGERNDRLFDDARILARKHKLDEEAREKLTAKYLDLGLPLNEIIDTLDSAAKCAGEYPIYPRLDDEALKDALEVLGVECRYNLRSSRAELRQEGKDWKPTNDRTVAKLVTTIAKRFSYSVNRGESPLKYGRDNWNLNFSALLKDREVDPFLLWLESLPQWDRTERIDKYLIEFFKTGDTAIARWVSQFLLLGPIQRGYKPGSKLDEMPVLWGAQGIGKSALLRALLPPEQDSWFCDSLKLTSDTKTRAETLQGRVLVEVSEMTGARQADLENLKTFISQQDDGTVRFAYRHDPETMLRRCILAGTSNNELMLPNDPTGLRRFIPLKLNDPKHATEPYIAEQREQLWAEALSRYREGVRAGLPFELRAEASKVAERHRSTDEIYEDKIQGLPEHYEQGASLQMIAVECGLDVDRMTPFETQRVTAALRVSGWESRKVRGKRMWVKDSGRLIK